MASRAQHEEICERLNQACELAIRVKDGTADSADVAVLARELDMIYIRLTQMFDREDAKREAEEYMKKFLEMSE